MATGITNAWSTTPASNATADTALGPREGWAPSSVNDTIRSIMAMVKKFALDLQGVTVTGGSSTAYTLTTNEVLTLADGVSVTCRMSATNGAAPTLNVDSTGAVAIQCVQGTAITPGTLLAGAIYSFTYYASSAAWIVRGVGSASKFVGEVFDFAGATVPALSLLCYGQAVSRTTYAALFAAISTTYGVGDGSTTFHLPDCRGRVRAGQDDMGGSSADRLTGVAGSVDGDVLGGTGGEETHVNTTGEMPVHAHGVTDPGHSHTASVNFGGVNLTGSGLQTGAGASSVGQTVTVNGNGVGITIDNAGGGNAHNNVQPTIIMNTCIFAGA